MVYVLQFSILATCDRFAIATGKKAGETIPVYACVQLCIHSSFDPHPWRTSHRALPFSHSRQHLHGQGGGHWRRQVLHAVHRRHCISALLMPFAFSSRRQNRAICSLHGNPISLSIAGGEKARCSNPRSPHGVRACPMIIAMAGGK